MSSDQSINVGIRIRPLNSREVDEGQGELYRAIPGQNAIVQVNSDGEDNFSNVQGYDHVFDPSTTTEDIYNSVGRDIVDGVVNGINGTIFAYGQTSSGKTFTMLGAEQSKGILEMAAEEIFTLIGQCEGRDFLLRVSFVEIYNEMIRDLLSDAKHGQNEVAIREDPRRGVYCEAEEIIITDYDSIISVLKKGISKRSVASTEMNDTSSRSHTIFKIVVESKERPDDNEKLTTDGAVLVASLNLVDLAGSESVRHTGATGQRQKEGGKINQSLLSLSRVIHALGGKSKSHISFRDSKLTRLLQASLSGSARMSVVCCVTPAEKFFEETRSTLAFASRAKLVRTNATVNEVLDDHAKIKRLERELRELRQQNENANSDNNNNNNSNDSLNSSNAESNGDEERMKKLLADKQRLENLLVSEREKHHIKINCLKELVVRGGADLPDMSLDTSLDMTALLNGADIDGINDNTGEEGKSVLKDGDHINEINSDDDIGTGTQVEDLSNDENNTNASNNKSSSKRSNLMTSSPGGKKKTKRDTWCPGFDHALPPPPSTTSDNDLTVSRNGVSTHSSSSSQDILEARVAYMTDELHRLRDVLANNKRSEVAVTAIIDAENEMRTLQEMHQQTMHSLTQKQQHLQQEFQKKQQELDLKTAKIVELNHVTSTDAELVKKLKEEVENLKEGIHLARKAAIETKEEMQLEIDELTTQLEENIIEKEIKDEEKESVKAKEKEMIEKDAKYLQAIGELESLRNEKDALSSDLEELENVLQKKDAILKEKDASIEDFKMQIIEFNEAKTKDGNNNIRIEESTDTDADVTVEIEGDVVKVLELEQQITTLTDRHAEEITVLDKQVASLEQQCSEGWSREQESRMLLDAKDATIAELSARVVDMTSLQQQVESLQKSLDDADTTSQEMNEVLMNTREERTTLEDECSSMKEKVVLLETQLESLKKTALSQDAEALITEMNVLMEQKAEAEGRAATAESNARTYREQLAEHDQSAAKEQEAFVEAAEIEMDVLRKQIKDRDIIIAEKDDALADVENELFNLQQLEQSGAFNNNNNDNNANGNNRNTGNNRGSHDSEEVSTLQKQVAELTVKLDEKEKRIAHLETTKLTKEQMEKIKTVKEERKKFYDEGKQLKKQLKELKKAYDELAASPMAVVARAGNGHGIGADALAEANLLQARLTESKASLMQQKQLVDSLKEKLTEASKQLGDYEGERRRVINVLSEAGFSIEDLISNASNNTSNIGDVSVTSMDDSMEMSIADVDLADAVKTLVSQHSTTMDEKKAHVSSLNLISQTAKEQEELVTTLKSQLCQAETLQSNLRKEVTRLTKSLEASKTRINDLTSMNNDLEMNLASLKNKSKEHERDQETNESELLALQEENLELMKENKELRVSVQTLKSISSSSSSIKDKDVSSVSKSSAANIMNENASPNIKTNTNSITTHVNVIDKLNANAMNTSTSNGASGDVDDAAQLANPEVDGECQQS